jgi:hypothetical protein
LDSPRSASTCARINPAPPTSVFVALAIAYEDPMNYRTTDFDLRPRRAATSPTPMLSTFAVDDEGDTLTALATAALVPLRQIASDHGDARHTALAALPSALCRPAVGTVWPPVRPAPRPRRQREPLVMGTVLSAALALLTLTAAMLWRLEHPRVVYVEGAPPAVQAAAQPAVDAISSASRR